MTWPAIGVCVVPQCGGCMDNRAEWSPWALEILHTLWAEDRRPTDSEALVLWTDIQIKLDALKERLT